MQPLSAESENRGSHRRRCLPLRRSHSPQVSCTALIQRLHPPTTRRRMNVVGASRHSAAPGSQFVGVAEYGDIVVQQVAFAQQHFPSNAISRHLGHKAVCCFDTAFFISRPAKYECGRRFAPQCCAWQSVRRCRASAASASASIAHLAALPVVTLSPLQVS